MTDAPRPTVLKLGGELLDGEDNLRQIAATIDALVSSARPLVVVHGGGRAIDAELAAKGIAKKMADGLRITDAPTLGVAVAVLAGSINTRLVAALWARGVGAVGLTGADAGIGLAERAAPYRAANGDEVDLGLVGRPVRNGRPRLVLDLLAAGYVPVVASIGVTRDGSLLNVNADTLATHLAATLDAPRLIIAGSTPGVLDGRGRRIAALDAAGIARVIATGEARAGMVAKLLACRDALRAGVHEVLIVDGRHPEAVATGKGTRITADA